MSDAAATKTANENQSLRSLIKAMEARRMNALRTFQTLLSLGIVLIMLAAQLAAYGYSSVGTTASAGILLVWSVTEFTLYLAANSSLARLRHREVMQALGVDISNEDEDE